MAKLKLILTKEAYADFESAALYYETKTNGLGLKFEKEISELLLSIKENPMLFPVKFNHIRESVVKKFPFVINYEISETEIIILAIFNTYQNPVKKEKRTKK